MFVVTFAALRNHQRVKKSKETFILQSYYLSGNLRAKGRDGTRDEFGLAFERSRD